MNRRKNFSLKPLQDNIRNIADRSEARDVLIRYLMIIEGDMTENHLLRFKHVLENEAELSNITQLARSIKTYLPQPNDTDYNRIREKPC